MNHDELVKLIEEFAARIGEHATSVQILVTLPANGGGTRGIKRGVGDWYARKGMCHEMIESAQADDVSSQIAEKINPPNDDGDLWKKA